MATIQVGYTNILESATSITANSLTNYSVNRLFDRDCGKLWFCSSSVSPQNITIDQSTNPISTNCIIINKHRTSGIDYTLYYSSSGSSWSSELTWTQSDNNIIKQTFSSRTSNYWRLSHSSGTGTLIIGEIFLTNLISFEAQPRYGSVFSKSYNSKRLESHNGITNYISYPNSRRKLDYNLIIGLTDKIYWQNVGIYHSNYGPFFFVDHEGNNLFVELDSDLVFQPVAKDKYSLTVSLKEVI